MNIWAEAMTYKQLVGAFRARADVLAITREAMDTEGRLPPGYSGTLLGPKQSKKLGLRSLGSILSLLKLKIVLVESEMTPEPVKPSVTHFATPNKPGKAARNQR